MKKRNRVLEILICTALAAVVFLAYMVTAQDNGKFEIVDIEGDRAYLEEFAFEGLAGDETGQLHYVWKDGELTTTYYPAGAAVTNEILYPLREGKTGIDRYFKEAERWDYTNMEYEAAPNPNATVRELTKLEDLNAESRAGYGEEHWSESLPVVRGVEADQMDIYAEINDYQARKEARFFTGLTIAGKDYQIVRLESDTGRSSMILRPEYMEQLGIFAVEQADAWYAIMQTNENCAGEVSLFRIPKDGMVSSNEVPYDGDALYSTETYGTAEPLQTFDVTAENRIVALEKAGKDRLLLARMEQNVLLLELYDTEGKLLHQLKTDVTLQEGETFDMANMIQRENQLLLSVETLKQINVEPEDVYHYEMMSRKSFVVEQDTIKVLPDLRRSAYLDYQNGTILQMQQVTPEHLAAEYWDYMSVGYTITVLDAESGEELYRGELVTDFTEDYNKTLSAINIGQNAGFIKDRGDEKDWDKYTECESGTRTFGNILPVDGERYSSGWQEGHQMFFSDDGYYHYG